MVSVKHDSMGTKMINDDKSERAFIRNGYVRYITPSVFAMVFGQLAPLVDSVCVSAKLGDTALSAFSTVSPVYYFFNIIAVLGGMGGGIGIAKASGAGEKKRAARMFTKAIIWTAVAAIILSILCIIFINPLLFVLCATEDNLGYAREYLIVLLSGMVFYVLEFAGAYVLVDDNDPNLAMAGGIVMGVVNMVIDYVGLFVLEQGIWVTAFGSIFGAFCGICVFLLHLRNKDSLCRFVYERCHNDDLSLKEIIMPGTPEALMYLIIVFQVLSGNFVLSQNIGTSGLGNAAIIENLELIATIVIAGVSEAVMPLAASYYGERNEHGLRLVKRFALISGVTLLFPLILSLLIYPQWLMVVFTVDNPVMMEVLPTSIRIMSVTQLFVLVNTIFVNYLSSVGEEKKANVSFVIQGVIQIVLTLALASVMPDDAPWYAALASNIVVLAYFVFRCKMLGNLKADIDTNQFFITGGYPDYSMIKEWSDKAGEFLTTAEHDAVSSKLLNPFINALNPDKKLTCSFTVIKREDGDKSVILRYKAKHDITGAADEDEDENEIKYGEVICSEFNFVRRMMINFKGDTKEE